MSGYYRLLLASIYGVIAAITVMINAWITPISMIPDEANHFLRALQISQGQVVALKPNALESGGNFHAGTIRVIYSLDSIRFHHERIVTPGLATAFHQYGWDGPLVFWGLSNTAMNPPWSYVGAISGIWLGKALHLSVWHTVFLARIVTGLLAVGLAATAIALAVRGIFFLTALASLPMTLHLFGSCSQDALVIASAFLFAALLTRLELTKPQSWASVIASGTCLVLMVSKPPFVVLALMPFLRQRFVATWRWGIGLLGALAISGGWMLTGFRWGKPEYHPFPHMSAEMQVQHILHHPLQFLTAVSTTFQNDFFVYAGEFFGVLGWLDAPLPLGFYVVASLVLFLMVLPSCLVFTQGLSHALRVVLPISLVLITCVGVMASLYVIWTPVAADEIRGVQGRYFLPIFPFLIVVMRPDVDLRQRFPSLMHVLTSISVSFTVLSVIFLVTTLCDRYWIPM